MRFYGRGGHAPIASLAHEYEDALTAIMSGRYLETSLTIDPNDPPVDPYLTLRPSPYMSVLWPTPRSQSP